MDREVVSITVVCFLFLQSGRIGQQDPKEIQGGSRGINRTVVSEIYKARKKTRVVDMRMSEYNGIYMLGDKRRIFPITQP
jgi:hypothetical protein